MSKPQERAKKLPDDAIPDSPRWSRRRIARLGVQLLPVAAVLGAVIVLLSSLWSVLAGTSQDAFLGAIVGSAIAFCGALLLQYLGEVVRSWREAEARDRREAGIISALMSELGEAAVVLEANAVNGTTFSVPTDQWLTLRLQVGELWAPNSVFRYSSTYVQLKLLDRLSRDQP